MFRHITAAVAALILVSGCSGGGNGQGPTPQCPDCGVFKGTPMPSTSTGRATVQSAQTQVLPPPLTIGYGATITLPAATAGVGATINVTFSTATPPGLPPTDSTHTSLVYVALSTNASATFNGNVSVAMTYNGSAIPSTVYLAFYDGATWHYDVAGPATPSSLTFTMPSSNLSLTPGSTYGFALTSK